MDTPEENSRVTLFPVLETIEKNPFKKDKVPKEGILVTIDEVALVETRYKNDFGQPLKKILLKTDKGDIWATWKEVNTKLKIWFGDNTSNWKGMTVRAFVEDITVRNEIKKTVVFEKA